MTRTEQMIAKAFNEAFHKRAANTAHWDYVSPKAIRVHPEDLAEFFVESAEEREKRAQEYEPWFPEAAARERADARAMIGREVAYWIDPYCGQTVDVIYDDTVPRGTIEIVEADREG